MALKKNFFKGLQGGVNHSPIKMHLVPPGPLGFGANIGFLEPSITGIDRS